MNSSPVSVFGDMPTPRNYSFSLVNTNDGYLEFLVKYALGSNLYSASGIGWISADIPKYYLRLLRLNGVPISEAEYRQAKVGLKNSSYIFKDESLNELTLDKIKNIFLPAIQNQQSVDNEVFTGLIPRLPKRR